MGSSSKIDVQEKQEKVGAMQQSKTEEFEEKAFILEKEEAEEEEIEEEGTFEEAVDWYMKEKFKFQQKNLIQFEKTEKAAKEKPTKCKYTWKNMLANRKSKNMPDQEEEDSSDDEYLDYDNLHLSFDPEKCQKFHC